MNEQQILKRLHALGKAYAEGCFVRLCMQQIYTTETEPDYHDTSTLDKVVKTVRFGEAVATMRRDGNGVYRLSVAMGGYNPCHAVRAYAWQCPRDMESIMTHWYAGAVAEIQDEYRELLEQRRRLQDRQEDDTTVVRYYEDLDGNPARIQARVHRSIYNGLPDGIRIRISFMIFNTEVEDMAGLKKALDSPPILKFGDIVDLQDIADSLRKKAFDILFRMFKLDTYTQSKFEGRTEVTPDDLDKEFKESLKF